MMYTYAKKRPRTLGALGVLFGATAVEVNLVILLLEEVVLWVIVVRLVVGSLVEDVVEVRTVIVPTASRNVWVEVEFGVANGGIKIEVTDDKMELSIVEIGLGTTTDEVLTSGVVVGALVELVKIGTIVDDVVLGVTRLVVLAAKACCPKNRAAKREKFMRDFIFESVGVLK